jgi:hypothetical protein
MKTLTEVLNKVEELKALEAKLTKENPDLKNGVYEIKNVPLRVILKVADKLKIKPDYSKYNHRITLRSYKFQDLKVDITIESVPVTKKEMEPVPVVMDEFREMKGEELKKHSDLPF